MPILVGLKFKILQHVTMDALTELFSSYGICDNLVSDNGATFVSEKF